MYIDKIETFVLEEKLSKRFYFSQWAYESRKICVVKVTSSTGQIGWGEGYGPAEIVASGIKYLAPVVLKNSPLENELIWSKMEELRLILQGGSINGLGKCYRYCYLGFEREI